MKKQLLLFILTLLPMPAMADASGSCGENVTYTFVSSTGTLTIQGSGRMKNYSSTLSAPWYSYMLNIKTVIIGEGVTSVGDYAFYFCSSLTSVTIPNSVTSIGEDAFYRCSGLTSITIPNSVTSIGSSAFSSCSGLSSVEFHCAQIGSWFNGMTSIKEVVIGNEVTSIGNHAFYFCSGLTSVTIGNGVTSIGNYAFYGCSGLQKVIVPDIAAWCGISFADYSANPLYFVHHIYSDENTEIKELVIPDGVTSIGNYAFDGCSGLTSITIPNSVTSIGDGAFSGCSGLSSVEFHCAQIGSWFSGNKSIKEIVIGNEVTSIESGAFQNCSGLTTVEFHCAQIDLWFSGNTSIKNVTIGDEVTSIGSYAFSGCSGLTSVTIGNSVTSIGYHAFEGCSGLTSVTIPNSVTSIGDEAFKDCSGITSVTIGNSVTNIGKSAFEGCSGLTSVYIGNSVTSIGYQAFYNCSGLTSVTIGNSVTSIENQAFYGCSGLQKVIVPDIAAWCGINFVNSSANPLYYAHHIYSDEDTEITDLVIPNSVTRIRWHAFSRCSGLTSVVIPNSVTSIESYAFSRCSGLTSVVIPNSVTSIGSYAFSSCSGLTSITIPNSVTSIGEKAFSYCSGLTSVTIPNSVTSIGQYAFYNCSGLMSVTIGSGVTSIGKNAFSCGIKLSTVNVNMIIPIEIDESVFEFIGENYSKDIIYLAATLNVPIGSKALYSNVKGWKKFMNIDEVDFTPKHKLVYVVDGVEYKVYEIAEGATITPEPAPTKEGYTFSGWSEIPETMPAYDVTVTGTFSINKYKLTYKVDGVEYKSYELEYGAEITPEPAPTKEGYTFSGWSEIPETMPAYDVTVTGSFTVNQYLITYMIGDEVYQKAYVDYGATIVLPDVPEREGYSFAWIDAPEKMPAHDITINGAYTSGIWGVSNDDATTNTYTISGYKTDKPSRGVNIIRMSDGTTRKVVVK